jgi:exodeoxyribonuclease VII large subunit
MWRPVAGKLTFKLADGLQVVASGNLSVYEKRGQYQIIVGQLMPKGLGALQLAFEQLTKRLAAEGLFDPARKRPIPALPRRIGLVTSPTGAAIRDFLNIIRRRYPNIHIIINPVRVQGDGAAEEISAAVDQFNALDLVDVIIVTRGGGSLEDLWAFNEEIVARALARSKIPTISAVGHEIDFTIADFVADLRAPTPSAAAELVVKSKEELVALLGQYRKRLDKDLRFHVSEARQRLTHCVLRQPAELVRQYQQQVDDLAHRLRQATGTLFIRTKRQRVETQSHRLTTSFARQWREARQRLSTLSGKLDLLSPKSTLSRGYSITLLADTGHVVRSVTAVNTGTKLTTKLLDGELDSVVSSDPQIDESR